MQQRFSWRSPLVHLDTSRAWPPLNHIVGRASCRLGLVIRKPNRRPISIMAQMIAVISSPKAAARSISPVKLYSRSRMESGRESAL